MSAEPQNPYDDPEFFAGYSKLERFGEGWTKAFEHPTFMALLPEVSGRRVLDLGCGAGQLAHHLATERGAADVVGVDISERMLELARAERSHPRLTFVRESLEQISFPSGRFDLVVSSLAFHYVGDYRGLIMRIADWLAPGGVLVYSTEHPLYLSRSGEGWALDAAGRRLHWAVDAYADEGLREEHWFKEGIQKYHRTFSTLLNGLLEAGLSVERMVEPVPDQEVLKRRPEWVDERRRPIFLLVRARKPGGRS